MWKRKQLIIAIAVVGLVAAVAPAWKAVAASASPFGQGNPLHSLQGQIDSLKNQLQGALNPPSPTNLTGDYATLTNVDCMYNTAPFGSNFTVISNNFTFTAHRTNFGTIHYNGNGTATQTESSMGVNGYTSQGKSPIVMSTHTCPVTYTVNADGTFTQVREGCINSGGPSSKVEGNIQLQGRISNGGKMLLLAGIIPAVETLTNRDTGVLIYWVCTRSIVATKIN